jgi:hypothetical protein
MSLRCLPDTSFSNFCRRFPNLEGNEFTAKQLGDLFDAMLRAPK